MTNTHAADRLRVGVVLPGREAAIAGGSYPRRLVEIAALAEAWGYDSVWAGESPLARSRMDPLLALAGAAAVTEKIQLGSAVLLPLRSPVQLAHELATLDGIAQGRLVVGLGAGFKSAATEAEFDAYGVPFRQRVGRLSESAEICRRLWATPGEPVSFEGKYVTLRDVALLPAPHRPGGPPLWLAGASDPALERAGRLFDGWMPTSTTAAEYAEGWQRVSDSARAAGREPGRPEAALYLTVAVDSDADRAEETLQAFTRGYYRLDLATMRTTQGIFGGTADQVAAWIGDYVKAGARHVALRLATADLSENAYRWALRRVAEDLLPRLRELDTEGGPGTEGCLTTEGRS